MCSDAHSITLNNAAIYFSIEVKEYQVFAECLHTWQLVCWSMFVCYEHLLLTALDSIRTNDEETLFSHFSLNS